jgi:hypothetical protein
MSGSKQRLWHVLGWLALAHLTACSFGGGEETPAPEVAAEGEATNVAEAPEGAETDLPTPSDAAAEATAGVSDPSTMGTDAGVAEIPPELLGSIPSPTEGVPGAEGTPPADAGMGMPSPMDTAAGMGGMENAGMAAPSTPPADAVPMAAPTGDSRVYYVAAPEVAMKDKPDAAGQTVGQLMQGDPVLVKIEGNWANVMNRGWVEVANLSMNPVARSKPAKVWN